MLKSVFLAIKEIFKDFKWEELRANKLDSVDETYIEESWKEQRAVRKLLTDHWLLKASTLTMYYEVYNIWRSKKYDNSSKDGKGSKGVILL